MEIAEGKWGRRHSVEALRSRWPCEPPSGIIWLSWFVVPNFIATRRTAVTWRWWMWKMLALRLVGGFDCLRIFTSTEVLFCEIC